MIKGIQIKFLVLVEMFEVSFEAMRHDPRTGELSIVLGFKERFSLASARGRSSLFRNFGGEIIGILGKRRLGLNFGLDILLKVTLFFCVNNQTGIHQLLHRM